MSVPEILFGVAVVPFIIGLVSIIKGLGLNSKFAPVPAVVLGLAFGIGHSFVTAEIDIVTGILWGLFYGLSAVGLYSAQKNVREGL